MAARRAMAAAERLLVSRRPPLRSAVFSPLPAPVSSSSSSSSSSSFQSLSRNSSSLTMQWQRPAMMYSCCAGLGSPPPREIIVEYCEDAGYTDHFISLANAIEETYPELVVAGNPEEIKPRKGSFEIRSGDSVLFSKLQSNRMPQLFEVLKAIDSLPPSTCNV